MSEIDNSPLAGQMIFSTGASRSGTYWLQRIVMAHPDVFGIPSKTLLFSHGMAPLLERFHHGARGSTELGAIYADLRRGKALAWLVCQTTVTDASGNTLDMTEMFGQAAGTDAAKADGTAVVEPVNA